MSRAIISWDTETTGLNAWIGDRPFAVSAACLETEEEWYWEWVVNPATRIPRVSARDRRDIQALLFEAKLLPFFNAKFDVRMLATIGIEVRVDRIEEVSFMAKACNSMDVHRGLNALAKDYFDVGEDDEKELHSAVIALRRKARKLGWKTSTEGDEPARADKWLPFTMHALEPGLSPFSPALCKTYALKDARRTALLREMYAHGMEELGVRAQYKEAMRLWPHVYAMEERGIAIDMSCVSRLASKSRAVVEKAEATVNTIAGKQLNLNSPYDVSWLLEKRLKLEVRKRTKTKLAKTDAETLAQYSNNRTIRSVLEFRANSKALSTFFNRYEQLAVVDDSGCSALHPDFRQWGTITNRFSCAVPNMQQVSDPNSTNSRAAEFVVNVREAFVPRPEHVWYCLDYSQLEVIIFADVSGEPTMLKALESGEDIHDVVTESVWGGRGNPRTVPSLLHSLDIAKHARAGDSGFARVLLEENDWCIVKAEKAVGTKHWRKLAKAVTFTKIFGGGTGALMSWIGCGHDEARIILSDYGARFPIMRTRMKEMEQQARMDGKITNSFGLQIIVDQHRAYAAINWRVQSDAACLMKLGMRKCGEYLERRRGDGLRARMLMTIHDELVFEVHKRHASMGLARKLASMMEDHGGVFSVKTPVEIEIARERWSDKKVVA